MAQTSHLWSRGLVRVFLTSAVLLLVSATQQAVAMDAYTLSTEITNLAFSDSLLDSSSNYYKSVRSMVDLALTQTYNISGGTAGYYLGTADMKFTKGQLINVETTILLISPNSFNSILLKNIFTNYMERTTSTPFAINSLNTFVKQTTLPATTRSPTTYSSREVSISESASLASSSSSKPASSTLHSHTSSPISSAVTNHTDWTSTASEAPTSSVSKPTPVNQKGSTSTGTTPYPLWPYWLDWVPGWGIALLVLASLILLLLIILIILLLLRWCCMDEPEKAPQPRYDPYAHEPYLSHSPAKTPILKHMGDDVPRTPEKPRGNRTGMYVVNP